MQQTFADSFVTSAHARSAAAPSVDRVADQQIVHDDMARAQGVAEAAGPVGGEILVNSFTTGTQTNPAIARLSDGSFVVAWTSAGQDGSGEGVYAQRFAASGTPIGAEFRIATTTADDQHSPALAALSNGGFVVTWQGRTAGTGFDIYGQRYNAAGTPQGGEFLINNTTASYQGISSVAGFPGGGFVVTWESLGGDETADIYARRYNADGSPAAAEFRINSFTAGNQDQGSVAVLAGGGFVVTWQSANQDGNGLGVYGQLYDAAGVPVGGEFRANTTTAGSQRSPAVTALEGGGFVVVWCGNAVRGQIYAADGTPVGGEIVIATGFNGVSVTALRGGGFAVSWDELASLGAGDGNGYGVVARAFNANGQPLDQIVVVNETVTGDQRTGGPRSLVQLSDDSVAFVWSGAGTGDTNGVFLRRFTLGDEVAGPGPIVGTSGNDTLTGTTGDDVIRGLGGNDAIDGLGGNDIAEYRGVRSDYRVTVNNGVYTIDDQRDGSPDGTDTLTNVEQLRFGDGETVAIADAVAPTLPPSLAPLTGATLINAPTETGQVTPMTVALTGGGYAVVWLGGNPLGSGEDTLMGRAFDAAGQPVGSEFIVGTMDWLSEEHVPSLTALAGGGFAVTWIGKNNTITDEFENLHVRIYDASGVAAGLPINIGSTGRFSTPVLVGTSDGGFLLIREPQDGIGEFSTTGQFFNSAGTAIGSAFPIAANVGDHVSAAILANGDIVIAWNEFPQSGGEKAFVRLFSPTGQPRGDAFVVDTAQAPGHNAPSVAALAGGGFVVTWFHSNPDADVYARIFNAAGNPVTTTFTVNENTAGKQWYGYVEALDDGGFVVSWTGTDGSGDGVFARVFSAAGQPRGGEVRINPDIAGNQEGEIRHLAQLANGDLIISWTGDGENGSNGVFTRRFSLGDGSGSDTSPGTSGDDMRVGTSGDDLFYLQQGGDDTVFGGDGDDGFYFGAAYTGADIVDGGPGSDQLGLQGDYSAGVTLGTLSGVEMVVLLPGDDNRFGGATGTNLTYNIVADGSTIVSGNSLQIQANMLRGGETLIFDGSASSINFIVYGGLGTDILTGGSGNDGFFFGQGRFGAGDVVNGGAGTMDQLGLQGNFTISFGASQLSGIEFIVLLSAADSRFGMGGGTAAYDLTMHDGNVGAGERMIISATALAAGENMTFIGSAETDGSFQIFAGASDDTLLGSQNADDIRGGAGNDAISGNGGADTLYGGAGNDTFFYGAAAHSLPGARDQIMDFATGDRIDLSALAAAAGGTFTFIGSDAPSGARQVRVVHSGNEATVFVFVDGDGTADMAIDIIVADGHQLTLADFGGGAAGVVSQSAPAEAKATAVELLSPPSDEDAGAPLHVTLPSAWSLQEIEPVSLPGTVTIAFDPHGIHMSSFDLTM